MRCLLLAITLVLGLSSPAAADDGGGLRRTTPRAALEVDADGLRLGTPGGRAWGVEGVLLSAPRSPAWVDVRVAVTEEAVREAFVRVAWYARAEGRSRQIRIDDSAPVTYGEDRVVRLALNPPDAAVAYRLRILVRLREGADSSGAGAVRAAIPSLRAATPLTRLVLPAVVEPYSAE